ncbi:hypothetical protein DEI81_09625 [Curtobacterium sp. MCBD17_013]|uniref:hypothetical protein n=1 Tax=Curtobacterium sp. MCBD17_013 TaxID=2175668 RepID=UPI000DA86708|nr:hypothetical protein [Curtobacterium sp. MCBD17_013]PZF62774.1 hypothetical protein DEI81_09625 [Curtobacterium sp. MCBD17_013]
MTDTHLQSLALAGVVASGLPNPLPASSARYTVPAVFNRRPEPMEAQAIVTSSVRNAMATAGYPEVTLEIADRRLLIGHTSLEELEQGLAEEIATVIDEISRNVAVEKQRRIDVAQGEAEDRDARAKEVTRAAERISFTPRGRA